MRQTFVKRKGIDVAVQTGMRELLVDKVELHAARRVVALNRLQTGDVPHEWWSRKTAENKHRMMATQLTRAQLIPIGVIGGYVRQCHANAQT
jgi:hypothetical protein